MVEGQHDMERRCRIRWKQKDEELTHRSLNGVKNLLRSIGLCMKKEVELIVDKIGWGRLRTWFR